MKQEKTLARASTQIAPAAQAFFEVAKELQNLIDPEFSLLDCQRNRDRTPRSISISVQPLNEHFHEQGEPFWLVSRDISVAGLGLVSYEAIKCEFVRIGLLNESVNVIGRVRHNTSIGNKYPLYLVGVEFLNEIEF